MTMLAPNAEDCRVIAAALTAYAAVCSDPKDAERAARWAKLIGQYATVE